MFPFPRDASQEFDGHQPSKTINSCRCRPRVTQRDLFGERNLDQATVAGKGAAWGHGISGEDVHAASSVDSLGVRAKPSARVQASHSRHDAIYIVGSGRINVAGMTEANMDRLCEAVASVL